MNEARIISLIASATEIVCALGLEEQLVGRSHECDFPASISSLPICTSPKFDLDGTSYEIEKRVKAIVSEALSVYRVDARLIEELMPSHIITQSQCEVCAVSLNDVEQAVCQLTKSRPRIVSLEPNCLSDVWQDIFRVATAFGIIEKGQALVESMVKRIDDIANRVSALKHCPKVAYIEWISPLMAGGNWMPELITIAGGISLFGEAGKHSPWMTWEALVKSNPDLIVIAPCGFDIARTLSEMDLFTSKSDWSNLAAVQSQNVFVADGNQYFNRPGPRLVDSLEILVEMMYGQSFSFGHEGCGWVRC